MFWVPVSSMRGSRSKTWCRWRQVWPARSCARGSIASRPFHLRPSLRADSQRRMPARPPGRVRGERRRIRIWRHGEHPPCGLEDYGILLSLAGLQVHIPAFDADLPDVVDRLFMTQGPAYHSRLGISEEPRQWSIPPYAAWRKLVAGNAGTIVAVGPLAGSYWQPCADLPDGCRPNLWCLSELPSGELPNELLSDICGGDSLCVAEEHVATGGASGRC